MRLTKELKENAEELKEHFPKLTDFEALQIAAKVQQARIWEQAFLINTLNAPVALEAIAMALGYENKQ